MFCPGALLRLLPDRARSTIQGFDDLDFGQQAKSATLPIATMTCPQFPTIPLLEYHNVGLRLPTAKLHDAGSTAEIPREQTSAAQALVK